MIKLNTLLYNVAYGTTVVLVESGTEEQICTFTQSKELQYKREYEKVEPHLDRDIIVISTTPVGGLYLELI